jgi:cell division protease FtsH
LLAARRNKKEIAMVEIDDAIDRIIAGTEKRSRKVAEKEKQIVAYHEAGHTIVGVYLKDADGIHKVTVVPRGNAGGYAVPLPKEERFMMTEQELKDKIVGLLGGRVAEEIILGEVSTGASNDFQRATGIARSMVMQFGMSRLGPLQFGESQGQVFLGRDIGHERNYSEAIAHEIDQEVQRIIKEQYERCKELLTKYRDKLELIATTLLEVETLTSDQIQELVENGSLSEESLKKAKNTKESKDKESKDKKEDKNTPKDDVKVQIQSKKEDESKFIPTEKEDEKKDPKKDE